MDDEFVKVTFSITCPVLVDRRPTGITNVPFQVQTGTHTFGLETPQDYAPKEQELLVINTLPSEPMIISFKAVAANPGKG